MYDDSNLLKRSINQANDYIASVPPVPQRIFDPSSHAERAFAREENSIVGFGPGMGGALIGNNSRRGTSIMIQAKTGDLRNGYGSIGWSAKN